MVALKAQSVPRYIDLPGRVVALATAEIRPQVDGIIKNQLYKEGSSANAGDILYKLEDRKFSAAFDAAAAAVKKNEATVQGAKLTVARDEPLLASKAISAQDMDAARTALLQADADLEAAKAELEAAQINLDDTSIRAPISGIIGLSSVSVGALVTANQTDALATIRQIDPVYVDLVDSSANLLRIRDQLRTGKLGRPKDAPSKVSLTLENGDAYDQQGEITHSELVVSQTTGTFAIRTTFRNPDLTLLPGMFVRARVDLGTMPGAFLVPQRAVTRDSNGNATAYFLSKDSKAELRTIVADGTSGNDWIVTGGIRDGDRIIIDGLQKISDGTKVKPVEAKIDADGVIEQTIKGRATPGAKTSEASK